MSSWTHVRGQVVVHSPGLSQPACEFIVAEVVQHLPKVSGSEGPMSVTYQPCPGYNASSSHDEFGQWSGGPFDHWKQRQENYILTLYGDLRDREIDQTLRELMSFMNRLAKRLDVEDVLLKLTDDYEAFGGRAVVISDARPWQGVRENLSWRPDSVIKSYRLRRKVERDEPAMFHRRFVNHRYDNCLPQEGNWTERLVNLVPSGARLANEVDYLMGNLEPFEYRDLDGGLDVDEWREFASQVRDRVTLTERNLEQYERWMKMEGQYKCKQCGWTGDASDIGGKTVHEDYGDVYVAQCTQCGTVEYDGMELFEKVGE